MPLFLFLEVEVALLLFLLKYKFYSRCSRADRFRPVPTSINSALSDLHSESMVLSGFVIRFNTLPAVELWLKPKSRIANPDIKCFGIINPEEQLGIL